MSKQKRSFPLVGVDVLGNEVKLSKDVVAFTGHNDHFRVTRTDDERFIRLVTPNGTYPLQKHKFLNIYQGTWGEDNKRKMHIILKKVVGELIIW